MPLATTAIRAFLEKWETRRAVAYIPCRCRNFTGLNRIETCGEVIGASGVTIGTGLDLGQQSLADLRRMGMTEDMLTTFAPYIGKKRSEAVAALTATPLTLSDRECDTLDAAVHGDYIRRAAALYSAKSDTALGECPPEAQAVIVSLFYHLGNGQTVYPKTWSLLCAGDWSGAAHELRTGFTRYPERRADEGALLLRIAGGA